MKRGFLLSLLYLVTCVSIYAQDTIDEYVSTTNTAVSAYVVMDELPIDSLTVYKGIGMPRVKLIDSLRLQIESGQDFTEYGENHAGLKVYNVSDMGQLCPGFHTWNGKRWVPEVIVRRPNITVTDIDGNMYHAKWFGNNACRGAYWMTSNLYVSQKWEGGAFSSGVPLINPAYGFGFETEVPVDVGSISSTRSAIYGLAAEPITTSGVTESMKDYASKFGLLYSWEQAYDACPEGWNLPTDKDWKQLIDYHGGLKKAAAGMRKDNFYYLSFDNQRMKWGFRDPVNTVKSGFDAVPSGNISFDEGLAYSYYWGTLTAWWSATAGISSHIRFDQPQVLTSRGFSDFYLSVRCVKQQF